MQEAIMPTRRPARPITEKGVLLKDAATDAELIRGLMAKVPNDLGASVSAVLSQTLASDLRTALGGPETILEHVADLAREAGKPLNEKELHRGFEAALRELGGDSAASVEPAVVQEELEHAKHALVTYWLSLLITAWDLWGRPADGLTLDPRNLLPDAETCPRKEALGEAVHSLNEALASNIALDVERDVPRALQALASSVYAEAQHHAVTLPRSLTLTRSGREVRLHEARRVTAGAQASSQSRS
jgi:hypothetical protein